MDLAFLTNCRVQLQDGLEKGRIKIIYQRDSMAKVLLDDGRTVSCQMSRLQPISVYLYRVLLVRDSDNAEQYGILEADNFFDAEDKGKAAAKRWEDQGFRFHSVNHEETKGFKCGEVHWL